MRRYWIQKKDLFQDKVNFTGDVFHHIFDVCRQTVGSKFEVLTEDSKAYFVEVLSVSKKTAQAQLLEERIIPPLPEPRLHLALAISRFPVMDAVIEKAVEMGISSVQPFFSELSFLRKEDKVSDNKLERWDKIVRSATQQCGRGDLMAVHPPRPLAQTLSAINPHQGAVGLFAYEGPSTLGIKEYVKNIKSSHPQGVREIWMIVGSEGGFSKTEVEGFLQLGLHPVTLGPQVLRVETACMALTSVLKYDFDLMC
ncbi:MAG: 16S rRNA (uracil(1498)-N(3))-methyltransferase [Bdellovibrio sp.]